MAQPTNCLATLPSSNSRESGIAVEAVVNHRSIFDDHRVTERPCIAQTRLKGKDFLLESSKWR